MIKDNIVGVLIAASLTSYLRCVADAPWLPEEWGSGRQPCAKPRRGRDCRPL